MKISLLIALGLMFMVLVPSGCTEPSSTSEQSTPPTTVSPTNPLIIRVEFPNGAPALDETAELTCTMVARYSHNYTINLNVELPDAFELVSGSLSWSGDKSGSGTFTLMNAQVKATKVGNWTITAKAHITTDSGLDDGDHYVRAYVMVMEDSAAWGDVPPWYEAPLSPVPSSCDFQVPQTD